MERRKRTPNRHGRLWTMFLAAVMVCALTTGGMALAAPAEGAVVLPDEAAPKPVVTIQGNVVVEKKKPTGFYELALCVKTARTIVLKADPTQKVDEATYTAALEADPANADNYIVTNYPFQAAAATVRIDLDALTAVTWGTGKPIYSAWTAGAGYANDTTPVSYPRGLDLTNADQPDIFTDLQPIINGGAVSVRLDTANPDEVTNATALIEDYDAATHTALLTLSANTTTTANVVYPTETPVVVVRFAYDMNRFSNLDVGDPNDPGSPNTSDFWVGLDKSRPDGPVVQQGKTALTYLADRNLDAGGDLYSASDEAAAEASIHQVVWYTQNMISDEVGQKSTNFYYYLGAETPSTQGTGAYKVVDNGIMVTPDPVLTIPKTAGNVVLAKRNEEFKTQVDPETAGAAYSFFQNLLTLRENTLKLTLVNAETYRKPTGGIGGAQILFYDWDDSLIGALVVDPEGDAREAVNEYVERVMIHPELRTSDNIASAADLTALQGDQQYVDRVDSLSREHTYRGEYAYMVGQDGDDSLKRTDGGNYPLTNKLDYAFYRRVTRQIETVDAGTGKNTRYFSADAISTGNGAEDYDGYLYPYVYGWAIVEDDTQDLTKDNWILHKDSVKTEDTWTTFGVGELGDLEPDAGTHGTVTDPVSGDTVPYTYAVNEDEDAWYLKFADFSAMEKMLRDGQDVLIVKAVYEPGESLLPDDLYTVIDGSLHVERYSYAASTEESVYSFQYQYRRANDTYGALQGVKRTRLPAVQTGFTYDVNAFDMNPQRDTKAFYMKTISDNVDILDIDITAGGVLWKVDYVLVDTFGYNISTGVKRSAGGELDLKKNFLYEEDVEYPDRQGTDGFVLQATLNTLLAEATKGAKGEDNTLADHFTEATIADLNLKANSTGDLEFDFSNYDQCAVFLQDLVTRLYNDGASIDPKTGNVTLGWHQIQRHILLCMQAGGVTDGIYSGGSLMSEAQCAGFPWCRLDDCAKDITVDIYDLGDIFVAMDKAKDETGDKHPAKDALDKLLTETPSLLDGYYQSTFRKDEDGRKFQNRQEMLDALEKVYDILDAAGLDQDAMKQVTAEQVQELIITETWPTTGKTYWWQNGGKRPIATWKDFIEAGVLVATGDVPDALDAMTDDNLPNAVQDMISYAPPAGAPDNVGWFRYKDSEEDDNAFADVAAFKTKWIQALKVLGAHYTLPDDWDSIPWAEIQYALINGTYQDAATVLGTTNYWWKDGGLPKLTYEKLLVGINDYYVKGDATELDRLLAKGINPVNNEVYLRRTAAGSGFTSVDQFKLTVSDMTTLLPFATNGSNFIGPDGQITGMTIHQMQYVLLNYNNLVGTAIPTDAEIRANYDYWWIEEPHLPTAAQPIGDVIDLLTYAYWAKDGIEGTMLSYDPLAQLDAATMTRLGLRMEVHGVPYTAEDVRAAVLAAITKDTSGWPYTIDNFSSQSAATLTKELQYALLHNSYQTAGTITENYWWQGEKGFAITDQATLLQAAWMYYQGFNGGTVPDGLDNMPDLDFITRRMDENNDGLAMRASLEGTPFAGIPAFQSALEAALDKMAGAGLTYDDMANITQHQLQYLLLGGEYKSDADVKAEVIVDGVDAYWWFEFDEKPGGSEGERTEITVDPDEWTAFMTSAAAYFQNKNGNPAGFVYNLTDENIEKVLHLHKGDGSTITVAELFAGDRSDLVWRTLDAIFKSSRKKEFFNTLKRTMIKQPTWYEFQYVLAHLDEVADSKVMPDSATCEAEKENWDWIWEISGGPVEYEQVQPDATEWSSFMTSAAGYFQNKNGNPAAFVYELTDTKIADTLYLAQGDGSAVTTGELFVGDRSDLIWRTLDAIFKSNRKKEFFNTLKRTMIKEPTWYEFQYVMAHLNEVADTKQMPTAEECEAWATQENAPWVWREKTTRSALFELEEEEPSEPAWVDEEETPPERPDESPGREETEDERPEVPLGDEAVVVTEPITEDIQGGNVA